MFIFVCHSSSVVRCDFPILCTIYFKIKCILQNMLCSPLVSIKVMGCFVIYWVSQIIVEVFDILCRGEVDTRQHSLTSQNWCFVSFTSVCKNVKKKETNYKSCQTSQQTVPIKYLELDWEFQVFCQGGIYCFHLVTDRGWAEVFWAFVGQHRAKGHFCTMLDSTSCTCGHWSPVWGGIEAEEILYSEDHHAGGVQAEEGDFVLVTTRQHLVVINM